MGEVEDILSRLCHTKQVLPLDDNHVPGPLIVSECRKAAGGEDRDANVRCPLSIVYCLLFNMRCVFAVVPQLSFRLFFPRDLQCSRDGRNDDPLVVTSPLEWSTHIDRLFRCFPSLLSSFLFPLSPFTFHLSPFLKSIHLSKDSAKIHL